MPSPFFLRIVHRVLVHGLLLLLATQAHAVPKVVVSMLPVHSLVSAVMGDIGEAQLLMAGGQSPHASQLKPSQVNALLSADLIVWVGALLEPNIGKIIAQRRDSTRVITLLENDAITKLPTRRRDNYPDPDQDHDDDDDDDPDPDTHAHHNIDPHVWLSFDNAHAIVGIVADQLARLDSANRDGYQSNAENLLSRLQQLRQSMQTDLRAVNDFPYVVFHDAYQYFENEFDLHPLASLTVSAQRPTGARRIRQIKQLIQSQKVRCVFSEPQFQPGLMATLVADTDAKAGILDPLGADIVAGPDAWFELMRKLADGLTTCLR